MRNPKIVAAALALAALLASSVVIGKASAMPMNGLVPAAKQAGDVVQDVRWRHRHYRYYHYGYRPYYRYGYRPYYGYAPYYAPRYGYGFYYGRWWW